MSAPSRRRHLVKLWTQNDWGRYARRDERLCRAWASMPRVASVTHLEPASPRLAALESEDGGVRCWRPATAETALDELDARLEAWGCTGEDSVLWLGLAEDFGDAVLARLGDRFGTLVVEVEDDLRCYQTAGSEAWFRCQDQYERAIRRADLLVSNSARMLEEFGGWARRSIHLPNGVDLEEFSPTGPEARLGPRRPRLVYVGNLRRRLRVDLLEELAAAFPEAELVLAGEGGEFLPRSLRDRENLRRLGPVPVAEVPALLRAADVVVLPHRVDPMTEAMDPQKLREALASGRPVVSTSIAGARERRPWVRLADDAASFVAEVRAALQEPADAAEARIASVRGESWRDRARAALDAVDAIEGPGAARRHERRMRYFEHARPELAELLPACGRVLDLGCGAGALGRALRRRGLAATVEGVERDPAAAARARERLDRVHEGDVGELLPGLETGAYDAVVVADLLEHLDDPASTLVELRRILRPGGHLLLSLPNLRHWSVLRELLEGDFRYREAGILDHDHRRFFTRRSARRLLEQAGLEVEREQGVRWHEERAPAAVVEALAASGLAVEDLEDESSVHQWLWRLRPTPSPTRGALSVVVPVCNAVSHTRHLLERLHDQDCGEGPVRIVVDDGSTDETPALLRDRNDVQVVTLPENRGFAAAINRGLAEVDTEFVCFLNNDTHPLEGWDARLVDALRRHPDAALVGPCTSYAKGRQQIDPVGDELAAIERWAGERARRCSGRVEDVSFLSGFCLVGRTEELRALGGLAEAYGRGTWEDDELCRRLRRAGRRLLIVHDAYVHHFGNRTFRALGEDLVRRQEQNRRIHAQRHRDDPVFQGGEALRAGRAREAFRCASAAIRAEARDLDALALAAQAMHSLGDRERADALRARYRQRCPAGPVEV